MARPAAKTKLDINSHKKEPFLFDAKIKNAILTNLFLQNIVGQWINLLC